MKSLYVVGNSHAHFFTFTHPGHIGWSEKILISEIHDMEIHSCSIGPTTAYKFGVKHLPLMLSALEQKNVKPGDYILVPVGEVDCRLHIPKHAFTYQKDVQLVTEDCLHRFFNVLKALQRLGYKPIAWGGHPSTDEPGDDDTYPRYADTTFRNYISQMWAQGLELKSRESNIYFASIFDELIDQGLRPKKNIFQDGCHLKYEQRLINIALDAIYLTISS